jgi:hypothetical protein
MAILLAGACGAGGPPSSPSYPAIKGTYGSYAGTVEGWSRLRWIAADGTVTTQDCRAVTSIPNQNGAQFSGDVDRLAPCSSQATLAGAISTDSTFVFILTQARWGTCRMTGGGQYTGVVNLGSLLANGRVTVQCDDGRAMTIEELLTDRLPTPPSTPG